MSVEFNSVSQHLTQLVQSQIGEEIQCATAVQSSQLQLHSTRINIHVYMQH